MCPDPLSLQTPGLLQRGLGLLLAISTVFNQGQPPPWNFICKMCLFSASLCSSWEVLFWELGTWAQVECCLLWVPVGI